MSTIITAVDIGSSKIRTVIGKFDEENRKFQLLGVGSANSNAIRKGNILDMEEFKSNLDKSLEEAERMSNTQARGVYICLNSSSFEVIKNRAGVAVTGSDVTQEDVDRALDMAKSGVEGANKEILKVVPEYFIVDLEEGVKNPVGMSARKLEVSANIFSMSSNVLNNIKKCVHDVGVEVFDIYPNLISSPEGVLSKKQKDIGVVCIDIGASTTGVTVYEDGVMMFSNLIPIGGENVTNDIALGVRTSIGTAEKLKTDYLKVGLSEDNGYVDKMIKLNEINRTEDSEVSNLYLSQIATARYEEIFYFVRDELRKAGRDGMLPEGAILVGGGSKTKGVIELAKGVLKLPCFLGAPIDDDALGASSVNDPVFAAVIGTVSLAEKFSGNDASYNFKGFFETIKNLIKKIYK